MSPPNPEHRLSPPPLSLHRVSGFRVAAATAALFGWQRRLPLFERLVPVGLVAVIVGRQTVVVPERRQRFPGRPLVVRPGRRHVMVDVVAVERTVWRRRHAAGVGRAAPHHRGPVPPAVAVPEPLGAGRLVPTVGAPVAERQNTRLLFVDGTCAPRGGRQGNVQISDSRRPLGNGPDPLVPDRGSGPPDRVVVGCKKKAIRQNRRGGGVGS